MKPSTGLLELRIKDLDDGSNVRRVQDDAALKELSDSIKEHGILEPVLVARNGDAKAGYTLVSGHRRVAAAKQAGLLVVPAIERVTEGNKLGGFSLNALTEVQLVENLQREDLNPIDEAKAFRQLLGAGELTQADLGKRIGKSQSYVANRIRLLELPENGQLLVAQGKVSTHVVAEILKLPEDADTERKRLVRQVQDQIAKNGEVSPREFKWTVQAAQRSYKDRAARLIAIEGAKFPVCPSEGCGKKGRPTGPYESYQGFRCGAGHRWSPSSGKLAPKETEPDRSSYRAPPAPILPEVDPMVLTTLEPMQIANVLVEAIRSVRSIELDWHQGTRCRLELEVDLPGPKGAKVPEFQFVEGRKFLELKSANWQPDDKKRKVAAQERAELEAWLATFGRTKKGGKR